MSPAAARPLVAAAILLTLLGALPPRSGAQSDPVAARAKGRAAAPVTVYEMSDFQCPYCRQFALNTFPAIEREYVATGKVRFVYINFPITQIHANAAAAAELAMCAARQDKFWAVHDLLFQRQDAWAKQREPGPYLVALGDTAGLDHARLVACLTSKEAQADVAADAQRAARAGARSTPTFYIEGGLLEGAAPVEVFRQVLDSIYRAKTARAR